MRLCVLLAAVIIGVPASAACVQAGRFGETPAARFKTEEEGRVRLQICSSREAVAFVEAIIARPRFVEELKRRIAMADLLLSTPATPGSRTLAGRIVVLLGPPDSFRIERTLNVGLPGDPSMLEIYTNAVPLGGGASQVEELATTLTFEYGGRRLHVSREHDGRETIASAAERRVFVGLLKSAAEHLLLTD